MPFLYSLIKATILLATVVRIALLLFITLISAMLLRIASTRISYHDSYYYSNWKQKTLMTVTIVIVVTEILLIPELMAIEA